MGALLLAGAAIVAPIADAGIWEPRELEAAELSRRIAARVLGASWLALPDDPASAPSLGDLRSGELPFVAIAAAFRFLGLHPWAGRLAMVAFAIAGLVAVWSVVARFAGPRAAALAATVLATTPLYAAHARTMLGDAAVMGAFAIAFAGLSGLALEPRTKTALRWVPVAITGLVAGFLARGLLFGVAVPLVSVSLGALLLVPVLGRESAQRRVIVGSLGLALGVACVVAFAQQALALRAMGAGVVTRVTAVAFEAPESGATFETVARRLGHALFPWSALAPLALARALATPPSARSPLDARGLAASGLRLVVVLAVGVAIAASTLASPFVVDPPFVGVAAFAAAVALAFDDLAEGARPSFVVALATLCSVGILGVDLVRDPARVLAPLGAGAGAFPESLVRREKLWIAAIACGVGVGAVIAASVGAVDRVPRPARVILTSRIADGRRLVRAVATAWNGNLAFLFVVIEAALVGLAAMVWVGRALDWSSIVRLPELYQHAFVHLFWMAPVGLAVGIGVPTLGADLLRSSARRLRASPPMLGAGLAALSAFAFVVGFHPTLAAQLSPREALEAFSSLHSRGEPLGLLGMSPRLVAYHGGGEVHAFERPAAAFGWLAGDDRADANGPRRWLVVPDRELAGLNVLHRERFGRNLPIADASSSRALLAVSDLGGLPQRSPLRDVVLDEVPRPARETQVRFGDELELLGWDVRDASGDPADAVATRSHFEARFYVRVIGPVDPSFGPFLHVDRGKLRFNGDSTFVDRGYGPSRWLVGDVVVLVCDVFLEANFPNGEAEVYFGFFSGGTRMKVSEGAASLDRAKLGKLRVR